MLKLIDSKKMMIWIDEMTESIPGEPTFEDKGIQKVLRTIRNEIKAGTFDLTPPVQPDITQRAGKYFIVSVKDEGFHLQSDEGEEVHYILIDINGRMEGYSDDLKEIESIYGRVTRIPGEVITDDQR